MKPMKPFAMRALLSSLLVIAGGMVGFAGFGPIPPRHQTSTKEAWVEAQLANMSAEERIGQLFFARAHSDGSPADLAKLKSMVVVDHIGGIVFFSGTPEKQATWTNELQEASAKTRLLIAMDAEWGPAMRMKDAAPRMPYALTMGASNDAELVRALGREAGRQLHRMGVHMSFSPVADLNTNPGNPVIGRRSFGEDPLTVGRLASAYARGLSDSRILAVAKHFPGHGDTGVDSHIDLPDLRFSESRLDSVEFVPFRMLAQDRIAGIMTGHLHVPAIDIRKNRPASLSEFFAQEILRDKWKYKGLIITDGLDMGAITKNFSAGDMAVQAVIAGNDILLIPKDIKAGIAGIQRAINAGELSIERINASVRRILAAKYDAGLSEEYSPLSAYGVKSELNLPMATDLSEQLYRKAVTLVKTSRIPIPVVRVDTLKSAVLSFGGAGKSEFQRIASKYGPTKLLNISKPLSNIEAKRWTDQLASYEEIFVGFHDLSWNPDQGYGILPSHLAMLRAVPKTTRILLVVFGSPYAVKMLADFEDIMVAYEDVPLAQKAAAEIIFGASNCVGILPVSIGYGLNVGLTIPTASAYRLEFSTPGNAGFSESGLRKVDALVKQAIESRSTPGGVVLASKDGQIGLYKAYGHQTYAKGSRVIDEETVYDLASITKVAAATLSIMRLHERGEISIYDRLDKHLPWTKGTNKGGLIIQDVLAHRAQLKPWIPFYERTIVKAPNGKKGYKPGVYSRTPSGKMQTKVADNLFIDKSYRDTIYTLIAESELLTRTGYRYSDLGFYIMADIVKEKTGLTIDAYVEREFYKPLGLRTIGYNPLNRIDRSRIPPTEDDDYFRFEQVQGHVHDMGAAMLGGVSGHAGLFSDVLDLAVIMQMLLNEGYYGGRRYFRPETVRLFTTRHPKSTRRGLGWDMAELSSSGSSNMSPLASAKTFGHLGFTGTCVWADPQTGVIFVWLTNRTYPSMSSNKFGRENYRPRMQTIVYESLR